MALVCQGMMVVGLATNHGHERVGTGAAVEAVDGDYGKGFGETLDFGDH